MKTSQELLDSRLPKSAYLKMLKKLKLKCENCDFKTDTKEKLDKHSILKHLKMNYKDDSTAEKEPSKSYIKTESEENSAGINKTEKSCQKQNKTIEKSDEEKKYTCEECGKEYYSKKGLKYHNDAYHKVKKDLRRYPGFDPITFNFSENSNH